ncbi:MAG: hypothetical protein M3Y54_05625 [Bacteroidota bacterium]|nr:hypothetical protein [Bacteroidota bacterium]
MTNTSSLKSSFRRAIRCGTGRAYLLAQAHPGVDFSSAIIEVSLKNFAYDGQSEPSRAPYLYELYSKSAQQARIRRAVLRALATEQDDTWTLTQLFALALLFAQHGDTAARQALYYRFLTRPIAGCDWAGAVEIMTLDGLEGLKYIARKFGQALARNPEGWQDDHLIVAFQEQYPAVDAWAELQQLAGQDEDVRRYLEYVQATRELRAAPRKPQPQNQPGLNDLLQSASRAYGRFALRRAALKPAEIQQLAERLLTEQNPKVRENLLHVFTRIKFPLAYQPILALARQKINRQNRLTTQYALEALQHLHAPEIRAFALQRLAATTRPGWYTALLVSNYQAGDAALLTSLVARTHDEHMLEMLAGSYTAIYRINKTPECAAPLLALYQKMTCGIHRQKVVALLIENEVLPAWLNEELPFDSYAETRLLHQPPAWPR